MDLKLYLIRTIFFVTLNSIIEFFNLEIPRNYSLFVIFNYIPNVRAYTFIIIS